MMMNDKISFEHLNGKLAELLEIYQNSKDMAERESSFIKKFNDDGYENFVEDAMIEFMRTEEDRYFELYHAFLIAIKNATPDEQLYQKMFKMGLSYFDHTFLSKDAFINRMEALVNKVKFQGKEYTPTQLMDIIERADRLKYMMFDFILNPESTRDSALQADKSVKKYIEFELNK